MITYNDLYEALRKERYNEQLQSMPKEFIEDAAEYFRDKKEFSDKGEQGDLFSDIALKDKKKLENAISIFREIMLRRRKKILNLAFVASETGVAKKDFENLLDFEKELFEEIAKSLEKADKNLNESMRGQKNEQKFRLVRFLEDVSEFLDLEGNTIGPFAKGEIANIEKEIIDILSKDKRVEVIDED
jgi:DNA replication initiation complex subunit (GINS family)